MAGIDNHTVSLTKNGYHKLVELIRAYRKDDILNNVDDLSIDRTQARKMLAGQENGELPIVWDTIKDYPQHTQYALLFISIIFSHKDLIKTFQGTTDKMRGVIKRNDIGDKVYTNLVYALNMAGMIHDFREGANESYYNLTPIFRDMTIGPLAKVILEWQLHRMGWNEPETTEYFKRTFYEQCFHYHFHKVLGLKKSQFTDWLEGETVSILYEPPEVKLTSNDAEVSASLLAALAAKKFCVLCGTTGTGKTQTVRQLAHSLNPLINTDKCFNNAFIPVGAGWTDGRHLLGYTNPFGANGETYVLTPFIKLLLKSNYPAYSKVPFFLILDEMNLSHVELYFSRFLSLMETLGEEPIVGVDELQLMLKGCELSDMERHLAEKAVHSGGLYLTSNLCIVGTVNIDETTQMFSPKVLDRAFVIEYFPMVPSKVGNEFSLDESDKVRGQVDALSNYLISCPLNNDGEVNSFLDDLFDRLSRFRFGPRVVNEARRYFSAVNGLNIFTLHSEFENESSIKDRIIMQKILPKLHGNKGQLQSILRQLEDYCDENSFCSSLRKVKAMKQDLNNIGFANFFSMQ